MLPPGGARASPRDDWRRQCPRAILCRLLRALARHEAENGERVLTCRAGAGEQRRAKSDRQECRRGTTRTASAFFRLRPRSTSGMHDKLASSSPTGRDSRLAGSRQPGDGLSPHTLCSAPYKTNKGPDNDDRVRGKQFSTNPSKRGLKPYALVLHLRPLDPGFKRLHPTRF